MSYSVKNNRLINSALLLTTIGLVVGTGTLYRFLYSYNRIMLITMLMMIVIICYQLFLPSYFESGLKNSYNKNKINYSGLILIFLMLFIVILSDIINNVASLEIVLFYIAMLLLSVLLDEEYRNKIFHYYLVIIVMLSAISILFMILAVFTDALSYLPHFRNEIKFPSDFYYVWSIAPNAFLSRNQSIFWEPGAFGYHIMLATLLAYRNKNKFYITILLITGITTFSTSVYFFLFFILLYHLSLSKNKFRISLIILSIIIIFYIAINSILENNIIIRLASSAIFDKFSPKSNTYISFAGRSLYTIEAFKMFLDNILLGAGHYATAVKLEVVRSGVTVNSSGLIGLLAEFGLYGIFCIFLYIRFFKYFKIFAIPIALIWLNGEFLQYAPLSLFILADSADRLAKRLFP